MIKKKEMFEYNKQPLRHISSSIAILHVPFLILNRVKDLSHIPAHFTPTRSRRRWVVIIPTQICVITEFSWLDKMRDGKECAE